VSCKKITVNIVVTPTMENGVRTVRNPEYLTILANLAKAKGYKIEDQLEAAGKGMDVLDDFNDEQAQISAFMPQQQ